MAKTRGQHSRLAPARERLRPFEHLLGGRPDTEVAAVAGVSEGTVRRRREELGLSAFGRPRDRSAGGGSADAPPARRRSGIRSPVERFESLLGQVSDREIASRAGTTASAVAQYRRRRGISAPGGWAIAGREAAAQPGAPLPAVSERHEPELGTGAAAPSPAMIAYTVVLQVGAQQVERVVIGTGFDDAARRAVMAAGGAEVVALTRYLDVIGRLEQPTTTGAAGATPAAASPRAQPPNERQDATDIPRNLTGGDLLAWRRGRAMTQAAAADALGVRQGAISKAEGRASSVLPAALHGALSRAVAAEESAAT